MHNYYNPYSDYLKDERLELESEESLGEIRLLSYYLHPNEECKCPVCKSVEVIKSGTRNRNIKLPLFNMQKTKIVLRVHRYECKKCGSFFMDQASSIPKYKQIMTITKIKVMLELKKKTTFKDVAERFDLDEMTVISIFKEMFKKPKPTLSSTICVDEIKNISSAKGNYAFIIYNPIDDEIIDILEDRTSTTLYKYFKDIDHKERAKVRYFVSDMYHPYRLIKKTLFSNATHVVDPFHYARYITEALNIIRIKTMNKFNPNDKEYRILKSNWRLILERKEYLNHDISVYNAMSSSRTSEIKLVDDALNIDNSLSEAYILAQEFYRGMDYIKYEESKQWLDSFIINMKNSNMIEFEQTAKTFINWENEIINSFIRFGDKRLNNGPMEGLNSYLKEEIFIARGYKDFELFVNRAIYIKNDKLKYKN